MNEHNMAKCFTDRIYSDCTLSSNQFLNPVISATWKHARLHPCIKPISKSSNIRKQHFLRSKKPLGKMQSTALLFFFFVHFLLLLYVFILKLTMNSSSSMPAMECRYDGEYFSHWFIWQPLILQSSFCCSITVHVRANTHFLLKCYLTLHFWNSHDSRRIS